MTQGPRRERVSDLVQVEIARILHSGVKDLRVGFVTVTGVRMSADLKHARVFVSILEEGDARTRALEALQAARGFIRGRLGKNLRLRYTPEINFSLDTSIEYGARIEKLLEETRPSRTGPPDDQEPE